MLGSGYSLQERLWQTGKHPKGSYLEEAEQEEGLKVPGTPSVLGENI